MFVASMALRRFAQLTVFQTKKTWQTVLSARFSFDVRRFYYLAAMMSAFGAAPILLAYFSGFLTIIGPHITQHM